ncbi:hypothetical protein [Microbacterium sp. 1P10AE]|jgi:hypothetical protein
MQTVTLNNGVEMPVLRFGVFLIGTKGRSVVLAEGTDGEFVSPGDER